MRRIMVMWGLICAMFLGFAMMGCEKETKVDKTAPTVKKTPKTTPATAATEEATTKPAKI